MWHRAMDLLAQADRIQQNFIETSIPVLPVNIIESRTAFHIMAAVPGVSPDDLDVRAEEGGLVLAGRRHLRRVGIEGELHLLEIPCGRFERRIRLPRGCAFALGEVRLEQGLLLVTLRKLA